MATIQEVRHKAGRMLGLIRYGQALKSDDDSLLSEAYTQVYDELKTEGLNVWASDGAVPDRVAQHVAALMAFNVCDDKQAPEVMRKRVIERRSIALPEIRRLTAAPYESLKDPVDY